jgi:hypothetical protein
MAADAERAADTRGWLCRAAADLRGAEIDLAADPPLAGDVVFHCQQAAEKALKAFLASFAWIFRYPGELDEPPVEDVVGALALAREVFNAVLSRLGEDLRP